MFVADDPDMVSITVDPQNSSVATIQSANILGTTRVTAYDPNSGLFAVIRVVVEAL